MDFAPLSCGILPGLPGYAGFQPASGATGRLLNQEEAMDATPACVMMWFSAFPCAFALIPPAPFSPCGRRGSLDVLKPKTREGTQGLQKIYPCKHPPCPLSHTGRRGNFSVLMPETADNTQRLSNIPVRSGHPDASFLLSLRCSTCPQMTPGDGEYSVNSGILIGQVLQKGIGDW